MNFVEMLIYIILIVVLLGATMVEKFFFDINPLIWLSGGVVALILNIAGKGIVSLQESIISLIIMSLLTIVSYGKLRNIMGGGILKGIWMCSVFFGRYVIVTLVLFCILLFVFKSIINHTHKESLPGEQILCAMPLLNSAVTITLVFVYCFTGLK